ncbi:GntR family transcriptional regulator [Anaerobacterium chartisolvens]|uniref:GntR family transcriptional regulator n=1 Tax=Anaerobacterium chartisolvens TaxID=1297424 RepID=A0A369B7M9_9FIRM|nr:FadR/GntR family transcriptional regulator [Anaerobacterium chartisolvens]RCX17532.1 GntR family transcriptional regulator [Anaerobacterium chartisolvens]
MGLKPIDNKSVSQRVLEQIKDHIISGEWGPGTKIPGEMELVELFGVSRISVRGAIHQLVGMGILSIKRGEGTFVSEVFPKDYFNALLPVLVINKADLLEILEFREMMESESARAAAKRFELGDIDRMKKAMEDMHKAEGDCSEFADEDVNFHTAVALATHNTVIIKVNAIIHDMIKNAMHEIVTLTGFQGGLYYHKKILEAIIAKDEESAAKLMREHIRTTIDKVKEIKCEP